MKNDKLHKKIQDNLTAFNRAVSGNYEASRQMADDLLFAKVAGEQWKGSDSKQWANKPKPENNKIAKHINRLLGQFERLELNAKISSASNDATDDDAELLQSRWRNDFNMSDGVEAQQTAADEAFTCGFGAMKLVTVYEDEENPDSELQNIGVEPIQSACTSVVFSAGAIRKDKQDATRAWHLVRVDRHTIEEQYDTDISSFPYVIGEFEWNCSATGDIYIAHSYEVVEKTVKEHRFEDGFTITVDGRKRTDSFGQSVSKEELDDLLEFAEVETIKRNVKYVEYALMSGDQYLIKPTKTAFKSIPIIPQYGYHNVINGVEYVCGEVARQRDSQRFENMGMGALMEVLAGSQTAIPEYAPEQISRHAVAHSRKNIDKPAFLMSDPIKDKAGNIVQAGPIAINQPEQIGSGLAAALAYTQQAQAEASGSGQSTLPSSVSGEAVRQVNERQDDAFQPLMQNAMQATKALCNAWIYPAQVHYFSNPRSIRVEAPDGAISQVETLQNEERDGIIGPFKNSAPGRYDVTIKAGESHKSKKEADQADAIEILKYTDSSSIEGKMALSLAIQSTTGEGTASIRKMSRWNDIKMMMAQGMNPNLKTDEERQYAEQVAQQMQAAQQNQQQNDPMMIAAQAEMGKAEAALKNEENDAIQMQLDHQYKMAQLQLDQQKLQLQAQELGIKLQDSDANVELKNAQSANQRVDAIAKVQSTAQI
tara:strand:+ start:532 stop:2658 length:2127 start_codon:yes stop_codon:yes gene_type:complete